jgi:hypothetical protein
VIAPLGQLVLAPPPTEPEPAYEENELAPKANRLMSQNSADHGSQAVSKYDSQTAGNPCGIKDPFGGASGPLFTLGNMLV